MNSAGSSLFEALVNLSTNSASVVVGSYSSRTYLGQGRGRRAPEQYSVQRAGPGARGTGTVQRAVRRDACGKGWGGKERGI